MKRLTKNDVYIILQKRFEEGFIKLRQIPSPDTLKDLPRAAKRIKSAIENKERITIVGDYDVDGVVSTALMLEFFELLDYPVKHIIPNRFKHGYGLSKSVIDEVRESDLIITVDNGISAIEAANYCKELGIDLIITDHHTPGTELPDAYAIINPKQESCDFAYTEICGAQVAWFLIGGLKQAMRLEVDMKRFLDLLAIAIVADVMPLRHINRALVQAGLQMFEVSERPAVKFLRSVMKKHQFSSEDLAFSIAPVINSAGRMEDASIALDFLRAKDFFSASVYHARLIALNSMRKAEERRVFKESQQFVDNEPVIVSTGEDWNEGVVGIVAARLCERYKKPAIVLTKSGEYYKGSGRSLAQVDLYKLLEGSSEYLERFGGHKKAAGLALKPSNLHAFKKSINALTAKLPTEAFVEESDVLGELPFDQIDWELIDILESFAPYGESNPMPKFVTKDVEVLEHRSVGEDGKHLLMTLRSENRTFKAIKFKNEYEIQSSYIDIVFYPARNIFNNNQYIQLFVSTIV
ncbi:single-stranded-DNA-specific exonuclease RecJ [Nitratiruptor sp. YY09-18]|uniref:single-stranded-DNA-specific exonuclease RecJ n=1 Tax=Nitratiruptor sp. YY09-18 TaxID=2724901 RepID=UPI0019158B01|nr:single-stranded-DNA-specific exonuclease RecJ [Nitratiruptor sp. YY09-18]BCD67305.1 single-stranded-DNA-specific exonuclease [Nitratiruptor sp. YY09-18]